MSFGSPVKYWAVEVGHPRLSDLDGHLICGVAASGVLDAK